MMEDGDVPRFPAGYSAGMFPSLRNPTAIEQKNACVCVNFSSESLTSLTFQY